MTATITPRERADLRKRTCSRCIQGHHELCTTPTTCAHYLCVLDADPPAADAPTPARRNPIAVSPSVAVRPSAPRHAPTPPQPVKEPAMPITAPADALDFTWEEPPQRRHGRAPLGAQLEAAGKLDDLREHPGEWARCASYSHKSGASTAVKKLRTDLPDFEWEARTVADGAVTSRVYGRFPGAAT